MNTWTIQVEENSKQYRLVIMAMLVSVCSFLTYYCDAVLKTSIAFTHIYYIPIILASLWWKRKGLLVTFFLIAAWFLSHTMFKSALFGTDDFLQVTMFSVVGILTALVGETNGKTANKLYQANAYLGNLFNYASVPVIVWDSEFKITRFNRAFERLTGKTAEDVLNCSIEVLFPPDKCGEATRHIRRTNKGDQWEAVEIPILGADKTVRTVLWNSANLYTSKGKLVTATIAQGIDITEHNKAEKKLSDQYQKLRSLALELALAEERQRHRIASGLHDSIGQKLSAVKILAQTLRKKTSAEPCDHLDKIIDWVESSIKEVRELTFELSPKILYELGLKVALESLIEQIEKDCSSKSHYTEDCSSKFHYTYDGPVNILSKKIRLTIFCAIRELLVNTCKHAKAENVFIDVQMTNSCLRVIIKDDGVGFDSSKVLNEGVIVGGFGLFSIQLQLMEIDGQVSIDSQVGSGTQVSLICKLTSPEVN